MNSYTLSRQWFAFAFENPSKVKPIHGSIYFWLIELANRLGWPAEFGSPGSQCMAACGISSYNTYKKAFDELIDFGFIKVNRKSTNQYQSCVIALSIIDKAPYKALDKALEMHSIKHLQSTIQSTDSIIKPLNYETLNLKLINKSYALFFKIKYEGLAFKLPKKYRLPVKLLKLVKPKEKSSGKKEKVGRWWASEISFEDNDTPELRAKWEEWIEYKKLIKSSYKTQNGEQAELNKVKKYPLQFALYAIQLAIDKEWQGVVNKGTPIEYQQYANNPSLFLSKKGQPTLTVTKSEPEPGTPEYYAKLKERYTFSKAS